MARGAARQKRPSITMSCVPPPPQPPLSQRNRLPAATLCALSLPTSIPLPPSPPPTPKTSAHKKMSRNGWCHGAARASLVHFPHAHSSHTSTRPTSTDEYLLLAAIHTLWPSRFSHRGEPFALRPRRVHHQGCTTACASSTSRLSPVGMHPGATWGGSISNYSPSSPPSTAKISGCCARGRRGGMLTASFCTIVCVHLCPSIHSQDHTL